MGGLPSHANAVRIVLTAVPFFRRKKRTCKKGPPLLGNHTQQPFEVVARRAQNGMQLVAFFTLKVARKA